MARITYRTVIALAAFTSLATPTTSHAQFGGLIKKKIAQTAVSKALPQPEAPADTQAARRSAEAADSKARQNAWAHPTPITTANLGTFMTAIHAEQTERAKGMSSADSPLARVSQYNAVKKKCTHDLAASDTMFQQMQADAAKKVQAGNSEALVTFYKNMPKVQADKAALSTRCGALKRPELTDADFTLIRAQEAHEDSVGAAAGGFSSLEYGRLRERVIAYVMMPSSGKPSGYAAAETQAIDARRTELQKLLGDEFESSGQRVSLQ
ncbi:MAG: hypothetical protein ABIQ10_16300 [Gemmatimonadaceae bacterium]